jgi:hypothetical protein
MKRAGLRRRPRKRLSADERSAAESFHDEVCATGCAMCTAFGWPTDRPSWSEADVRRLEAHHIISAQTLTREGLHALLWAVENGLCLCRYHHARHENWVERVPAGLIPDRARLFAYAHGLASVLLRQYPSMKFGDFLDAVGRLPDDSPPPRSVPGPQGEST